MPTSLNLFPARVAIGRADASGAVYMTTDFSRALADLLVRVGGPNGASVDDLGVEAAHSSLAAAGQALEQTAADLSRQAVELAGQFAVLAELRKCLADLERAGVETVPPTDWEHPGKIGATTANSGKFTTLEAADKVKLNPADKDVEIKPTGVALVTIKPAAAGQVDNMELGKTTPQPARVTSLNKITVTQPANGATLTLADGATLVVPGAGGTLGSAAYASAGAFAARTGTALGGPATDAATTQTLVNNIRSVLLSVGIGS